MKAIKNLLKKLSNAHGTSGYESSIRQIMVEELTPYVDDIQVDTLGNLIATKKGNVDSNLSVMIASHMDEIGLMVKHIDDKGFLKFVKIGGWFDQTLLNQRVIVHTQNGKIYGVIGSKPPHRMKEEEKKKPIKAEDMFIDVGCSSKEDAEKLKISIGSPVTLDREFVELANDLVTCKSFDNRAGVVMLIEAMKRIKNLDNISAVYAVGTVQEEVGLKGAKTSAYKLNPTIAIAIDTTICGDHPGIKKEEAAIEINKGAAITVLDASGRGIIVSEKVLKWLKETATKNNIDYQLDVTEGGTTDATAIHLTKVGIPTGVISVPTRYIHSPVEVLSLKDLDKSAELIARAVESLHEYF